MKSLINMLSQNKRIFSIFGIVWFFLFPQLCFGATASTFNVPANDLSVILLGKIFGTVGGGLETGGTSILGKMFYVFNSGILIVIGVILIYIVGRSIFEISHGDVSQSQMGRKFTGWQVARVVLGTGAIVPHATGYSAINVMIIWVVIQGVGMANAVWNQAVTYIAEGNKFYIVDKSADGGKAGPSALIDEKFIYSADADNKARIADKCENSGDAGCLTATEIMRAQICMNALYRSAEDYRTSILNNETLKKTYSADAIKKLQQPIPRFREAYYGNTTTTTKISADYRTKYRTIANGTPYRVEFPGNAEKVPVVRKDQQGIEVVTEENYNGKCGVYSWGIVPTTGAGDADKANYLNVKEVALRSLVSGLSNNSLASIETYKGFNPAVATASNSTEKLYPSTKDFPDYFQQSVYTSLVYNVANYQSTVFSMRAFAGSGYQGGSADTGETDMGKTLIENLTENGWLGAGAFYLRLTDTAKEGSYVASKDTNYYPKIASARDTKLSEVFNKYGAIGKKYYDLMIDRQNWKTQEGTISEDPVFTKATALAKQMNESALNSKATLNLPAELSNFSKAAYRSSVAITNPLSNTIPLINVSTTGFADGIVLTPLNTELVKVFRKWSSMFAPDSNEIKNQLPLIRLHDLGVTMIQSFFDYWSAVFSSLSNWMLGFYIASSVLTAASGIAAPLSLLGAGVGWQLAIQQAQSFLEMTIKIILEIPLSVLLPMIAPITLLLLFNGVLLAYYIPLLPFMLFLFGTITWFSFVIEGMVAGPLIALGVTHPEGHDLMGKAEQTLMLLVSLFVRPTVMIFGLVAGLLLSYVGLEVLNATFGKLLFSSGVFYTTNTIVTQVTSSMSAVNQVKNIAFILIYTFIVMSLMQQCFSLIHSLPSSIMQWIGLSQREGQEAQLAGEVKSNVMQTTDKAGSGVSSGASAASQGLSSMNPSRSWKSGDQEAYDRKKEKEKRDGDEFRPNNSPGT